MHRANDPGHPTEPRGISPRQASWTNFGRKSPYTRHRATTIAAATPLLSYSWCNAHAMSKSPVPILRSHSLPAWALAFDAWLGGVTQVARVPWTAVSQSRVAEVSGLVREKIVDDWSFRAFSVVLGTSSNHTQVGYTKGSSSTKSREERVRE